MNRVITINLNGVAYQLEESGYEALREYLDHAARRLEGNPDKDEIIADIEQAIADKFRALLGAYKTVVNTKEVTAVIDEMGPVQDASATAATAAAGAASPGDQPGAAAAAETATADGSQTPRKLYRIYPQGAMLSGVCNGLGAYFGIDPTIFRIAFVILTLAWGAGVLLYVFMVLLIPLAKTPAEKAAASGAAATAQEFIRRARAGYYEGMKAFHDKQAHREWKRKFRQEMRGWKQNFRQEMRENARSWSQHWPQHWAGPQPFGALILWPFLGLFRFAAFLVLLFAVCSLIGYGSVFGLGLPAGVPLWIGVLFLIVAFHLLTWPIKAYRRSCHYWGPGYPGGRPALASLVDTFVWLAFCTGTIWLADHYSPQFHAWLVDLPPRIHEFMDSLRAWWARR